MPIVIIFDECHRSQFGEMHVAITKRFKKYYLFGFTGTPIFEENASSANSVNLKTTAQAFGDRLHTYTIIDAIRDKNVLPFRIDYIKTMNQELDIDDKEIWDIDRETAFLAPERISIVTKYILEHFDQKTLRSCKSYSLDVVTNVSETVKGNKDTESIREKQRLKGFNSIFAVSSIQAAKLYYDEFQRQMKENPRKALKVALIYSYSSNEPEYAESGLLGEEDSASTCALDVPSRDFLDNAIKDYNEMFHTRYSTDGDDFQNYYKDISMRMKNREIDLLIVVNMFLTGFDATTLNTLWVDKNLKMHGLLQAFSRTNRILGPAKAYGNIVCFRPLQRRTDAALERFGDAREDKIAVLRSYADYMHGYVDADGRYHDGYIGMLDSLRRRFPLSAPAVVGESNQKDFACLFGRILRIRNILSSFDDFENDDPLSERDLQDYMSRYQDLYDDWRSHSEYEKEDIHDDVVFEIELLQQMDINIDYIFMLIKKYCEVSKNDNEIKERISKAISSSPELRSKKALIEAFLIGINDTDDVLLAWKEYITAEKEKQLDDLIREENLRPEATRVFVDNCFRDGYVKTTGSDIDSILPPISRFAGDKRSAKKQKVVAKLNSFFDLFYGVC